LECAVWTPAKRPPDAIDKLVLQAIVAGPELARVPL
jgi:hypothetical protein